jgi:nucleoside-diphosphate-sugar epimerase
MASSLFCFGYGYVARRLAQHLSEWQVIGTSRSAPPPFLFDGSSPLSEVVLKEHSSFLISIPPHPTGDLVLANHQAFFKKNAKHIRWVGYLSATNVYGDHQGAWVNESSQTLPTTLLGKQRLQAENQWLELWHQDQLPVHIFRLSGIYGPGRNVLHTLQQESPPPLIEKPGHVFSRIHVDDICQVLQTSLSQPAAGKIYNLADDCPASSAEVMRYGCQLLGRKAPTALSFEEATLSSMARDFYQDCKRVCNQRLKQELRINLLYPSYREGLNHCLKQDK